jgi:glycine/D-amino acid oxidase-like deaminating enzyme
MGCIESPVTAINRVRFNPIKSVDGVADIVRLSKSGSYTIYALTKRGTVYTNGSIGRNMSLSGATEEYATALLGLGLISKPELRVHKQWITALRAWRNVNDDISRFNERCERLGIVLDNKQTARIVAARAEAEKTLDDVRTAARRLNADRQAAEAKSKS